MATTRMKARERRRIKCSAQARVEREKLKEKINSPFTPLEDKEGLVMKLSSRPRDESPCRVRNRCQLCGRSRGVYRKFKLCRCCLRKAAMRGDVPGLVKASW
jgi:small subunit ribosomal protein S14